MAVARMWIVSAAVAGLIATTIVPQALAAENCNEAETQSAMNECAGEQFDAADGALNEAYREITQRLKEEPEALEHLRTAQRAWLSFRDAECRFALVNSQGGSIYPALESLCLAELSQQRAAVLEGFLQCEEGDLSCPVPDAN
jgi:uncharacterized protein YecT (DUF1311 family)